MSICLLFLLCFFFFSSRRRHTRCALVTGVQTCALPIFRRRRAALRGSLPHQYMLECDILAAARDARARRLDIGLGLRELGAIVAVVDAEQDIAPAHRLLLLDLDRHHIHLSLGPDRGSVAPLLASFRSPTPPPPPQT